MVIPDHKTSTTSLNDKAYQYKLVLLGESAVGKSSLVLRFVKNIFSANQESTIGGNSGQNGPLQNLHYNFVAAFLTQTLHVDGDTLKFEIWDTAGQERYHSLAPMYYRGANAAVVVYDITSAESFERAKKWTLELQKQAQPDIVIALVGNKTDLETQRQVSREVNYESVPKRHLSNRKLCIGCQGVC